MGPLWEADSKEQDRCLEDEAYSKTDLAAKLLPQQNTRLEWEGSDEQLVWNMVSSGLALESPLRLW